MTKREIAILACRILSIYLTVYALISVATNLSLSAWARHYPAGGMDIVLMQWGYMALQLILGIALWLLAGVIAKPMTADIDEPANQSSLNASGYLMVAFTTIGLYLLATAIISIIGFAVETKIIAHEAGNTWREEFMNRYMAMGNSDFITDVVRLALGLPLFLGSSRLVRLLTRRGEVDAR